MTLPIKATSKVNPPQPARNSLIAITILVGSGSASPGPEQAEKDLLELRNDDDHNDRHRRNCHENDRRRINRSRDDAAFQFDDFFD